MMYEAKCLVMDYQQPNSVHQQHLHQLHSFAPAAAAAAADASSRWSQYHQLWRQHQMFINGRNTNLYDNNIRGQTYFLDDGLVNRPHNAEENYSVSPS